MDPQVVFCTNSACPASGLVGKGNIWIHSRSPLRYRCTQCGKTFSHRCGTPFYWTHTGAEAITLAINLVAHGCPIEAIVAVFGFQARTVRGWVGRAGPQC